MKPIKTYPKLLAISIMAFLFLIQFGSVSHAADITISGHVYDSSGSAPIEGVFVVPFKVIGSDCGESLTGDTTDALGVYSLTVPDGSNYRIYADSCFNTCLPYIGEWYISGGGTNICEDADQINSTTSGVDFTLDSGSVISGTVTAADGGAAIQNVLIALFTDSACEGTWYNSDDTDVNGYYCVTVPNGTYYLYAEPSHFSPMDYAQEWYNETFLYAEASGVIVSGSNVPNINFSLDDGGSISGTVRDSNGVVENVQVNLWNEYHACMGGTGTSTDSNGNFTFAGLAPGPWQVSIRPEVTTGWVHFNRKYWLDLGEDKDIGTISLVKGALITGRFVDTAPAPIANLRYWYGGKFEIGSWLAVADGTFAFRLPLGTYNLNLDSEDSGYTMTPKEIEVTDVGATYGQGDLTAYASGSGVDVSGNIADNAAHNGEFAVLATLNTQQFTPENWGGFGLLGFDEPSGLSYSLFVPPGNTIDVTLFLLSENQYGQESGTVVDNIVGISSFPATGQDLTYGVVGYTVDGYVKGSGGIFNAIVLLYKQPGDVFTGFAETDNTGKYTLYNVPAGIYRVAVIYEDYPDDVEWSPSFDVNANVTVPDIFMDKKAMPWIPLLLLGD